MSQIEQDDLALADGFAQATQDEWRQLVEKVLKGAAFEKRLVSRTADGIALQPLYMKDSSAQPVLRTAAGQPWRITQRVDHPDPKIANELALTDLQNGADSLMLVPQESAMSFGYGLEFASHSELEQALADVALEMIALRIEPGPTARRTAALCADLIERRGLKPAALSINFGLDPLGCLLRWGHLASDWKSVAARFCEAVSELGRRGFSGGLMTCDVRSVHQAGGSEAQELAVGLAMGVAYLRAMADSGHDISRISRDLSWVLAIDADQFLGIAKLRAMRLLWARVEAASGLEGHPVDIHAETAWRMMSRRDAAVNMLRTTMATFTAGVGGADSITVLPYTLPLGLPNAFARRISRNTQTVLLEESNLWRVGDPVAGAGAYEAITDELCIAAWAAFQEIEAEGGLVRSLSDGRLQARISAVRSERQQEIARRKRELTGTSAFPNLAEVDETTLDVPRRSSVSAGAALAGSGNAKLADLANGESEEAPTVDTLAPNTSSLAVEALPSMRDSEPFEALRDTADAAAAANNERAHVFLANLGPLAEHGTRATWIRNFLAAGGIAAGSNEGFSNSADAGKAFADSGTMVACICGTDETYAQLAEATAGALKAAGAQKVYLAGRASEDEQGLREAGVDGFLFHGMNVVEALAGLQEDLGVAT